MSVFVTSLPLSLPPFLLLCHFRNRDELEDRLRGITMERAGIKESMVWCLDHAESADEVGGGGGGGS